jgi:3-oxoacyl-[acyl-carrier-protein] synthase-3
MDNQKRARLIGMGSFLPEKVLTNEELEKMVDTTDEWIRSRTGIAERRIAGKEEHASTMGAAAAREALERAAVKAEEIDLIIVATMTPDYMTPSTAALIQHAIGADNAAAVDIQAACTGYLYGLSMAKAYIESGLSRKLLLIATEKMSSVIDYKDRNTCILFGDGASAAVISGEGAGYAIDAISLGADGELANLVIIPAGGSRDPASEETVKQGLHRFRMEGREVFKQAVRRMSSTAEACLEKAGLTQEQVSWVVPHQANLRIIDAIAKSLEIPEERVYRTIHKYGNTSASSVAIALEELTTGEMITAGESILLVAFGAGLTWGAALLTKIASEIAKE